MAETGTSAYSLNNYLCSGFPSQWEVEVGGGKRTAVWGVE